MDKRVLGVGVVLLVAGFSVAVMGATQQSFGVLVAGAAVISFGAFVLYRFWVSLGVEE